MTISACGRCGRVRKLKARGLCPSCYNRINLYGDEAPPKERRTPEEHLARIDVTQPGCWLWPGAKGTRGYGVVPLPDGTRTQAHRWVYERLVAPIPEGLTIDHVDCVSKLCVRPDHLEVVTRGENSRRAIPFRKPQVRRGVWCTHESEDVYVDPTGKSVCRICRRERDKLWRRDARNT